MPIYQTTAANSSLPRVKADGHVQSVHTAVKRLDIAVEKLHSMVLADERAREDLNKCLVLRKNMVDVVHALAENYRRTDITEDQRKELTGRLRELADESYKVLPALQRDVRLIVERDYSETLYFKAKEKWVIIILATVNLLLALGAAFALSRTTSSRLKRLHANVQRYKRGESLIEPSPGMDEIGLVEQTFYESAIALRETRQREKDFVSIFTHDLRNPLTILALGLEQLTIMDEPALRQAKAKRMTNSVNRMNELILDLLDLHKVEAGMQQFSNGPFDLFATVKQACVQNDEIAKQLGVKVSFIESTDSLIAWGDEKASLRILNNLIGNALKHSPADTTVRVKCFSDGASAIASVLDEGQGIPQSEHELIFQPYRQGSTAVNSRLAGLGSGLGLAICKQFAEKQKGSITVSNGKTGGAEFVFRLTRG